MNHSLEDSSSKLSCTTAVRPKSRAAKITGRIWGQVIVGMRSSPIRSPCLALPNKISKVTFWTLESQAAGMTIFSIFHPLTISNLRANDVDDRRARCKIFNTDDAVNGLGRSPRSRRMTRGTGKAAEKRAKLFPVCSTETKVSRTCSGLVCDFDLSR